MQRTQYLPLVPRLFFSSCYPAADNRITNDPAVIGRKVWALNENAWLVRADAEVRALLVAADHFTLGDIRQAT